MNDLSKKGPPSAGLNAAEIASLFGAGMQRHQRGDLAGAWQHYEAVLARDPKHAESLHHLGIIATQTGRHQLAADLIGRAIGLDDRVPEFHYNIGIAFGSLGQFDKAVAHNRKAVALKPDYAAAFMNLGKALRAGGHTGEAIDAYRRAAVLVPNTASALLGLANALADAGRLDDAVTEYRKILSFNPNDAETHNNLGTLFAAQGKFDDAVSSYRQALRLNPNLATAEFNLANTLRDSGQLSEAADHYRAAVRLNPNFAEAHNNLGSILALENPAEACGAFQRAIAAAPTLVSAYKNLSQAARAAGDLALALETLSKLRALDNSPATHDLLHATFADPRALPHASRHRQLLIDLMALPRDDLRYVTAAATCALESNPVFSKCLDKASAGAAAFDVSDLQALATDPLLLSVLSQERISSILIERFLTAMRAALLETTLQADADQVAGAPLLNLQCALAHYCFQTEYVFASSERETGQVNTVQSAVAGALKSRTTVPTSMLVAMASYVPLHTLADAELVAQSPWLAPVDAVVEQQIRVPREVARTAPTIPRLTPIEDDVSRRVARQYEENPYPRWARPPVVPQDKVVVSAYLRDRFPAVPIHLDDQDGCDYLIAGCGTGQHAAAVAQRHGGLRITAIDLSRASLGYAKYKTDSLGLTGIAYGQADIMAVGSIGQSFDIVDSVGVLHHMASPEDGWRALLGVLRPKGCMRIALYSELARRNIVAARRMIAERGYGQSAEDIRRCRQELLALPEDAPERQPAVLQDFYSLSECRDLLFHVQEHRMTFPWIAEFLDGHGLELIGLEIDAATHGNYRARFPDDTPMTDLDNWHVFEQENPDLFVSMYCFWVQRKLGAEAGRAVQS